jgi:hypothetical protein
VVSMVAKDVALCIGFAESREVVYWQMVSERERQTLAPLPYDRGTACGVN